MTLNNPNLELTAIRLYEEESRVDVIASRYGHTPDSIIDFSLNVNPLGSSKGAIEAAASRLGSSHLYPDLRFRHLRSALAAHHGVSEDSIFFGTGLDDVIKLLLQAWVSEGDRVLVHIPTFPRYELEARLRGCRVSYVENDRPEEVNIAAIDRELSGGDIALTFLCTPNNPTGATIDNSDISDLATRHRDTIFIVDEALIFPSGEGAIPLCSQLENVAVLRTFSKYYGLAGLRVGYAIAPERLVDIAEVGRPPFNMAAPAEAAAVAALADQGFLCRCKEIFQDEVQRFRQDISSMRGLSVRGNSANMLLIDLGVHDVSTWVSALASRGIAVADATSFRGLENRNMLRVSLRSRQENSRLSAALRTCWLESDAQAAMLADSDIR